MQSFGLKSTWTSALPDADQFASLSLITSGGVHPIPVTIKETEHGRGSGEAWIDNRIRQLRIGGAQRGIVAEVPASPWGYPYSVALTHDIDMLSVSDFPWMSKTRAGMVYYSFAGNAFRYLASRMTLSDYLASVRHGLRAMVPGAADARLAGTLAMMEMEEELGVRSSCFFIARKGTPGIDGSRSRSCHYDVNNHASLVRSMNEDGWEIGLHGLNAWHDVEAAASEKRVIEGLLGATISGVRMHYLFWGDDSFRILEEAGFEYDSSLGFNSQVGTVPGTNHAFLPAGCRSLLELPLNVHDVALMGRGGHTLTPQEAFEAVSTTLAEVRESGGCLNLLFHNNSFDVPRAWGETYRLLLSRAIRDGALVTTAGRIQRWYRVRRAIQVLNARLTPEELHLRIGGIPGNGETPSLRLHISPDLVASSTAEWVPRHGAIDLRLDGPEVTVTFSRPFVTH